MCIYSYILEYVLAQFLWPVVILLSHTTVFPNLSFCLMPSSQIEFPFALIIFVPTTTHSLTD